MLGRLIAARSLHVHSVIRKTQDAWTAGHHARFRAARQRRRCRSVLVMPNRADPWRRRAYRVARVLNWCPAWRPVHRPRRFLPTTAPDEARQFVPARYRAPVWYHPASPRHLSEQVRKAAEARISPAPGRHHAVPVPPPVLCRGSRLTTDPAVVHLTRRPPLTKLPRIPNKPAELPDTGRHRRPGGPTAPRRRLQCRPAGGWLPAALGDRCNGKKEGA